MRRFLQVSSRGVASALSGHRAAASLESARSLGLKLDQRRAISLSQPLYKQRGGSSSTGDSSENNKLDKNNNKKKGLWEMASEKLSGVGASTRSAANKGRDTASDRNKTDRSMSEPGQRRDGGSNKLGNRDNKSMSGHDFDARAGDKGRGAAGNKPASQRASGSSSDRHRDQGSMADHKEKGSKETSRGGGGGSKSRKSTADHRAAGSVQHDQNKMRFVLDLGDNQMARIDYKPAGKGRIELYHTEVPEALRGRGIGRSLAKGAFEAATKAQLKLKVTCDYLEDYIKRHSDDKYKHLFE